jgi:4-amino-4-deoxy-L-arabinose transferase-like glycosyltransferase
VYFYLFVSAVGAMPWSFFLLPAIARLRTLKPRHSERDALLALAWIWVAVPLLFFSGSTSKLPGYILPIFPAMAIILGSEVERVWNGASTRMAHVRLAQASVVLTFVLLLALGAGAGIYLHRKAEVFDSAAVTALLGLLFTGVIIVANWRAVGRARAAIISPLLVMPCLIIVAVTVLLPRIYGSLSIKPLTVQIDAALSPRKTSSCSTPTGSIRRCFTTRAVSSSTRAALFTGPARARRTRCPNGHATGGGAETGATRRRIERDSHRLPGRRNDLQQDPRFQTEPVGQHGQLAALRVRLNPATVQHEEGKLLKRVSLFKCVKRFKHDSRSEPTAPGTSTKRSMSKFCKLNSAGLPTTAGSPQIIHAKASTTISCSLRRRLWPVQRRREFVLHT